MAFPYRYLSKGINRGIRVDQVTLRGFCLPVFLFPPGAFRHLDWLFILKHLQTTRTRASVLTPVPEGSAPTALYPLVAFRSFIAAKES